MIPQGAVKLSSLDGNGNTIERNEMILLDANGNPPENSPSSFDVPVRLEHTVNEEDFLDHLWKGVYQIKNDELAAVVGEKYTRSLSVTGAVTLVAKAFCWHQTEYAFSFTEKKQISPFSQCAGFRRAG